MKIGIIDWGIGGVGLLKEIRKGSDMDIIYFSDTGFTPYGKVPPVELENRLNEVLEFLHFSGCEMIAVACNAASTVLPNKKNIFGVIEPAIEMVNEMNLKSVAVVGGKRTIESEIYKNAFEKRGLRVSQQIAQPLSARIEAGEIHSEELIKEIEEIFSPIKNEKNILLACTHYPVISNQIRSFLPEANLIDPVKKMNEKIMERTTNSKGSKEIKWITTGNIHEMLNTLKIVYQIEPHQIERRIL